MANIIFPMPTCMHRIRLPMLLLGTLHELHNLDGKYIPPPVYRQYTDIGIRKHVRRKMLKTYIQLLSRALVMRDW